MLLFQYYFISRRVIIASNKQRSRRIQLHIFLLLSSLPNRQWRIKFRCFPFLPQHFNTVPTSFFAFFGFLAKTPDTHFIRLEFPTFPESNSSPLPPLRHFLPFLNPTANSHQLSVILLFVCQFRQSFFALYSALQGITVRTGPGTTPIRAPKGLLSLQPDRLHTVSH